MNEKQKQLNMTYYKRALSSMKIIRISERSAAINFSELGIEKTTTRRTSTHKPWEHYWEHRVVGMLETVKKFISRKQK